MSKPTGPIINGTSADVQIAGWMALMFAALVGGGLFFIGVPGGVAAIIGLAVFVVGMVVASVKTVGT